MFGHVFNFGSADSCVFGGLTGAVGACVRVYCIASDPSVSGAFFLAHDMHDNDPVTSSGAYILANPVSVPQLSPSLLPLLPAHSEVVCVERWYLTVLTCSRSVDESVVRVEKGVCLENDVCVCVFACVFDHLTHQDGPVARTIARSARHSP